MNIIYASPGLILVSVTMFWGVALKLVRYRKGDPTDIVAMLRHGTKLNGIHWTPQIMETWIKALCWPMGYDRYQPKRIEELRDRIRDAVRLLQNSSADSASVRSHTSARAHQRSTRAPHEHRTHSMHSRLRSPPPKHPLLASSDPGLGPHRSASHIRSPFSSPSSSLHIPIPNPWVPVVPIMPTPHAL